MRVSKKFLNDYVDISNIKYSDLAEAMVNAGNEYESIETLATGTNLVVGEILEVVKHPNSDKLSICQVNIGEETPIQILCGAKNVVDAKKVIVAKVGAVLPGGVIKKAVLAGMESNGMICSLAELDIDNKYLTEEDKNGIHILNEDAKVGIDALEYLGLDDEIIEFELTANRGDLLSILGMAYEVGAIYNKKVKLPNITYKEISEDITNQMSLDVKTDKCSVYLGKMVKNVKIGESPEFIKARLIASGIRPINNIVDISNYVMLEYGQPLHFFDSLSLGNKVIVRQAQKSEEFTTLDGIKRTLKDSDIVIANDKEAVCLAGVMGGLNTEVELTTKDIFVEAAIFDGVSIRYTSKDIVRSEASNRYEKGIDPNRTDLAINRACMLLEKYADGEVVKGMLKHDVANHDDKIIEISRQKIVSYLGMEISEEEISSIFDRLGFKSTANNEIFTVEVPTRRLDISIKEDLIEEVGRIYGYNNLKGTLPVLATIRGGYSKKAIELKQIRNLLTGMGLSGTINYSLTSPEIANSFQASLKENVVLDSPLSNDRKVLRSSLIPSLLQVAFYNKARNIKDILIYEIGSVYYKVEDEYKEDTKISGLLAGTYSKNLWNGTVVNVDFYLVKGIVENILNYYGLKGRYQINTNNEIKELHPGRSASIVVDRKTVGYLGEIHPNISKNPVYVFELDYEMLSSLKTRGIKFKEISKYPTVKKDVAFILNNKIENSEVVAVIKKAGGRLLTNVEVFDVYTGKNVKDNEKSLAYTLTFEDMTHTLTDVEVNNIFKTIIKVVEDKCDAKVRDN